jgi:hypothetical protein
VSCYDVLTRDLHIIFEELLCCVHFNVSAINYERISVLFYIIFYLCSAIIKLLTLLSFSLAPIMYLLWASFLDLK